MSGKVLVVMHKPYWFPEDNIYQPIQVGCDLHKQELVASRKIYKDIYYCKVEGNIGLLAKNDICCKLTALYCDW